MVCRNNTSISDDFSRQILKEFRAMLSAGAAYGYLNTDGSFQSNFIAYLSQEHIVLGMFLAHPQHPFSRMERVAYFINSLLWLFFLSALFSVTDLEWALSSFIVMLLTMPYNIILRALMECSCCVRHERLEEIGEMAGYSVMCVFSCGSILWLILGAIFAAHSGNGFVGSWILGQFMSWTFSAFQYLFWTWWSMKSSKEKFDELWGEKGENLVNYGQVAALAPGPAAGDAFHIREWNNAFELNDAVIKPGCWALNP
eukprot:jgi/Bigna1/88796/estExt_fgenesh1_pg.C_380089